MVIKLNAHDVYIENFYCAKLRKLFLMCQKLRGDNDNDTASLR